MRCRARSAADREEQSVKQKEETPKQTSRGDGVRGDVLFLLKYIFEYAKYPNIHVTWQPSKVDWNAQAQTMMTSLYQSVGAVDVIEGARVLFGCGIPNDRVSRTMNLHQILH